MSPDPIGEALTSLTIKQVADNQLRLLQLCERLIAMNIHPQVSADKLGITEDGDIKLYLDIDYCGTEWQGGQAGTHDGQVVL